MFSRPWRLIGAACLWAGVALTAQANPPDTATVTSSTQNSESTTDHSKLEALKGPFTSGPEVTKVCLSCHNKAGHQVMKSIHWQWEATSPTTG